MVFDLTLLNTILALWTVYYACLAVVFMSRRGMQAVSRLGTAAAPTEELPVVLVIPAHNEEAVLSHTMQSLLGIDYERLVVMVMNDGSTDATAQIASQYLDTGRVILVNRPTEVAGQGKGAVLNDAFGRITAMIAASDGPLAGCDPDHVILGVMDADGQLEPQALTHVVPLFADAAVGGVQIGVRIANAETNLLTRFQDMEFVGFSAFVQEARDTIGSVGLGGNGQFTRVRALMDLGRDPWTDCLTEDLDLGLSLIEAGWRVRFTSGAYVAQQGVVAMVPLLRQRTRWVQGHYQCWSHLPKIVFSRTIPLLTRIDLVIYLFAAVFILLIATGMVFSVLSATGTVVVTSAFLEGIPAGSWRNALHVLISTGPLFAFFAAYQFKARDRFAWWEVPTFMMAFSAYTYMFVVSQAWAIGRIITGRGSWAKTPRTTAEAAV